MFYHFLLQLLSQQNSGSVTKKQTYICFVRNQLESVIRRKDTCPTQLFRFIHITLHPYLPCETCTTYHLNSQCFSANCDWLAVEPQFQYFLLGLLFLVLQSNYDVTQLHPFILSVYCDIGFQLLPSGNLTQPWKITISNR